VDEDVVALLARDEAEALLRVEELHGTCGQNLLSSFKNRPLWPVPQQRSLRDGPAESPGQRLCPVYDDLVRRCPEPHGRLTVLATKATSTTAPVAVMLVRRQIPAPATGRTAPPSDDTPPPATQHPPPNRRRGRHAELHRVGR
jgi:hypothetical protein